MKTSIKILTICTIIISLSLSAQRNHNGGANNSQSSQNNSNQTSKNSHHHHGGSNWGGITLQFGGSPFNYGYGNNYNHHYYSLKKIARNSIRQSANVIRQALHYSNWNDTYSPWLAKAIRHQQYAKQLYFWGDYQGALNHAERAGYLAWNTLDYYNNSFYNDDFGDNNYPNPYSDPNNPYYKPSQSNTNTQPNTNSDEDFGYKKDSPKQNSESSDATKKEGQPSIEQKNNKSELDGSLPQSKLNDKELLKTNVADLDID